jgi:hypothetical protein
MERATDCILSAFGKAKGEDADMDAWYVTNGFSTGYQGSSCSTDVVDKQDMAVFQQTAVKQFKHVCHVLLAFPSA